MVIVLCAPICMCITEYQIAPQQAVQPEGGRGMLREAVSHRAGEVHRLRLQGREPVPPEGEEARGVLPAQVLRRVSCGDQLGC